MGFGHFIKILKFKESYNFEEFVVYGTIPIIMFVIYKILKKLANNEVFVCGWGELKSHTKLYNSMKKIIQDQTRSFDTHQAGDGQETNIAKVVGKYARPQALCAREC